MDGIKYRQSTLKFVSGDKLFLYTDGVTETTDSQQRLYGEDRLKNFLNKNLEADVEKTLKTLRGELQSFAGDAPQFDDITMLLLDFKGDEAMPERTFEAKDESIAEMLGFVEGELEKADCPMKIQTAVCVAMEEVFVNIAHYAYPDGEGKAKISVAVDGETNIATFVVSDNGIPFDPLAKADPDITLSADEREVGGLGIFIIKKTMDSVSYVRENGENRLTMTKDLKGAAKK